MDEELERKLKEQTPLFFFTLQAKADSSKKNLMICILRAIFGWNNNFFNNKESSMLFNNKHIDRYAATFEIKNVAQL